MNIDSLSQKGNEMLTYFSHSYWTNDLEINNFFWELFFDKGFYFEIDPRSEFLSIPYLEIMMRRSSCFVAVVPFRREEEYSRCSPYSLFEYGLATISKKPKIAFLERGVSKLFFEENRIDIVEFDRNSLGTSREEFSFYLNKLLEKSKGYSVHTANKIGMIIDNIKNAEKIYTSEIFDEISELLYKKGYKLIKLAFNFQRSYEFCLEIDQCDFLIIDEQLSMVSEWISACIFGRFIPCIRICHIQNDQSKANLNLTPLITKYYQINPQGKELENIIYWKTPQELIIQINQHIEKFEQEPKVFKTKEMGNKYFHSLVRKPIKVFISTPDRLNKFANALSKCLDSEFIDHFYYKSEQAIKIGDEWLKKIEEEIKKCGIFVALIDHEYNNKKWCRFELEFALNQFKEEKIEILPYYFMDSIPSGLELEHIQGEIVGNLSDDKIINKIIEDLEERLRKN